MAKQLDFYSTDVASVTSSTSFQDVATLTFTPKSYTKFVFVATGDLRSTNDLVSMSGLADVELTVDGTVYCEQLSIQHTYTLMSFKELSIGVSSTIKVRIKNSIGLASLSYKRIKIVAIGLSKWETVEQGAGQTAVVDSNSNRSSKLLMQQIFYPSLSNVLILTYAERTFSTWPGATPTTYGDFKVYLDDDSIMSNVLISESFGNSAPASKHVGSFAIRKFNLAKGEHHLVFRFSKQDNGSGLAQFRRLRAVIIPIDENPLTSTTQEHEETRETIASFSSPATSTTPLLTTYTGITYCNIGSFLVGDRSGIGAGEALFTYKGLGMAGDTLCKFDVQRTTYAPGGDLTDNYLSGQTKGILAFGTATDQADGSATLTATRLLATDYGYSNFNNYLLQFHQDIESTTSAASSSVKENYDVRTLVEIYKTKEITRFSLQEDTFLFAGVTSGQIISYYQSGQIDKSSLSDLTVTGVQAVEAVDRNDLQQARDLLDLSEGLPDGVTVSPSSEFFNFTNIHKLYKKSVLKSVSVGEKTSNPYSGVMSTSRATISLSNTEGEFDTDAKREEFLGSVMKVRYYDKVNNELRSIFSGRITDVDVGDTVSIAAINPNVDIMDVELPKYAVSSSSAPGITSQLADDDNAPAPVFYGVARRLTVPHLHKFYGTEAASPSLVDQYSDYAVGGQLLNTSYPFVVLNRERSDTGVYRNWISITNSIEFADTDNVVQTSPFTLKDSPLPTVRFQSTAITTPTRSTLLSMPHGVTNGNDDISAQYSSLSPVNEILYVQGHINGEDWYQDGVTSDLVNWSPAGTEPVVSGLSTTTRGVTRGTPNALYTSGLVDSINAETGLEDHKNIINISSIPGFTESTNYTVGSSSVLRTFEDRIAWTALPDKVSEWNFNGNIDDGVTTTGNNLFGTDGQPVYDGSGAALQFLNSAASGYATGSVAITHASITNLDFNGSTDMRLVAYVQQNADGSLTGPVVSKRDTVSTRGYELGIVSENVVIGGGSSTKFVAQGYVHDTGSIEENVVAGTTLTATTLNDGAIHKIELLKNETANTIRLIVDGVEEATEAIAASYNISNTEDFVIGGPGSPRFSTQFLGKIHKVGVGTNSTIAPAPGVTYSVTYDFKPDRYQLEWKYNIVTASNAIQDSGAEVSPIGVDARIAGATSTPVVLKGIINGTGATQSSWVRGPGQSGYALRLNQSNSSNTWHLGTAGLGVSTYLGSGGGSGEGYVTFTNNAEIMNPLQNFSAYGCGIWRGGPGQSGILLAKESSVASKPSFALGLLGGKAYGMITTAGTKRELTSEKAVDTKDVVHLMLARRGLNLYLYVNGTQVAVETTALHESSDYTSNDLVVGSDSSLSARWAGDVSFIGLADFSHEEFAAYQVQLMDRGVKGGWSEFTDRVANGVGTGKTLLHIPFTEGVGVTVSSRNLHRNFGQTIKRILTDKLVGLSEEVDGTSFDTAITVLDDLGLKCDLTLSEPRKVVDILEELLRVRGMRVRKSAHGRWEIIVDEKKTQATIKFGSGDGVYENILKVNGLDYRAVDEATKEIRVDYRRFADAQGEVKFHSSVSRLVLPYGTETQIYEFPSVADNVTADKIVDYLSKKIRYSIKRINITVGMEGRKVRIGDLVRLEIPRFGINDEDFTVGSTKINETSVVLVLESYSSHVFDFDPGPRPEAVVITGEKKDEE